MNTLVIVESPSKANTIKSFLGKGYKVKASKGHVRDLPKSKLGIDVEHDFEPQYINIRGKGELINELRKEAKAADRVLLAADPDREGEAISWHLAAVLNLEPEKVKRITFNEITKSVVKEAIKSPREIDMNMVNSQQTRRIMDRLVGYQISPFLWKKVKNGLSAGRVQSVATRIIVEREEEIRAFVPEEYWLLTAQLQTESGETFLVKYYGNAEGKQDLHTEDEVKKVLASMTEDFLVQSVRKAVRHRKPQPPFVTSTLQQEANRRLGFQSSRTMMIAQELYEGVNIGEKGTHGLITYMRTDSLRVSEEARAVAKDVILSKFGDAYYPSTPNLYKIRKNAQDAHEAIRPSDPSLLPEDVKGKLSPDQYKLYKLIWERFMASQMKAAAFDTVSADLLSGGAVFRATGNTVRFRGYRALYDDVEEEETEDHLPELNEGDTLHSLSVTPEQRFTQPPARYTEGSLIKMLEDKGIGRPSTYTATITTIVSRGYVRRDGKALVPTDLGFVTTDLMKKVFSNIVNYNFTAEMEQDLDRIERGSEDHLAVLQKFYADFETQLKHASEALDGEKIALPRVELDMVCEKCGAKMIEREGRYGKFAACPNYPKCRNTKRITDPSEEAVAAEKQPEIVADLPCPVCGGEMVARRGAYGSFFACRNYPTCKGSMPFYRDSGVSCPQCGKRLIARQTRKHKTYYCCETYPACDFSSWDLPTGEKCPQCGKPLFRKKGKGTVYCKAECGWQDGK
ncbi:MAG: type I DNA topoisomerase [Oscillospiraceae bacterium]|nr:type I DNA topoisomerase [Oscillospiraceae bacterium]